MIIKYRGKAFIFLPWWIFQDESQMYEKCWMRIALILSARVALAEEQYRTVLYNVHVIPLQLHTTYSSRRHDQSSLSRTNLHWDIISSYIKQILRHYCILLPRSWKVSCTFKRNYVIRSFKVHRCKVKIWFERWDEKALWEKAFSNMLLSRWWQNKWIRHCTSAYSMQKRLGDHITAKTSIRRIFF